MIKINDYVEGCEYYGKNISYIRGWVGSVKYDESGDNLLSCDIRCDDSYHGARGNSLIIDSNYPINVVEYETDWYLKVNRHEIGRNYFYRIGLDTDFLTSKEIVRFWDIDGVLAVFAYGHNGINVCEDKYFQQYMKEHDPYMDAIAPEFLKEFLWKYTTIENNYVISRYYSEREKENKCDFVLRNYDNRIAYENIYFVSDIDKSVIMSDILDRKYQGVKYKHCLIDDNISVLSKVQSAGLVGVHISSLLLLAGLK